MYLFKRVTMKVGSALKFGFANFLLLTLGVMSHPQPCFAGIFNLPQLDTSMADPIFRTLASGLAFKPVEPASDLGKYFGFYMGVAAGGSDLSAVSSIFQSQLMGYMPMGDLQLGAGGPLGITAEAGILPGMSYSGTTFNRYSGALKWTLTHSVLSYLPINIAVRVGFSNSNLNYSQTLQNANLDVSYKTSIVSGNLVISKSLLFLEPYVGIGVVSHDSTLSATGEASLFGNTFTAGTESLRSTGSSPWYQAGLMVKVFVLGVAAEYDNIFGLSSYNGKVSLRF
jgi:hypothetical protein